MSPHAAADLVDALLVLAVMVLVGIPVWGADRRQARKFRAMRTELERDWERRRREAMR